MKDWLSWTCLKPVIYLTCLKPEESFSLLIHLFEKYLMKRMGKMTAPTELIPLWQKGDSKQVSKCWKNGVNRLTQDCHRPSVCKTRNIWKHNKVKCI